MFTAIQNMKLDKICRTCLLEKAELKPIFAACIPDMIMSCTSIELIAGDGLPNQICLQCLQMVSRSYTFRRLCEKSDATLRTYINRINLENITLTNNATLLEEVKTNSFFDNAEDLQQASLFSDIFGSTHTQSLVDNFGTQNSTAVTDLAETMQSLQTIAEQCLPETWNNEAAIIISEETTHSTQFLKCQFCERLFQDEWSLSAHVKTHSEDFLRSAILDNQFQTTINEELLCKSNLKTVDNPQCKIKKHVCPICDKRFSLNKLLVLHLRFHTGEKPLSCEICGKNFALPSSLHKHKLVHSSEKKYNCTICGKAFKQSSNLNAHMHTHSSEKLFGCNICGRKCATNRNLKVHLQTHTGEKLYRCTECSLSFTTNSQLKKHLTIHTGEKPYKCWQCRKSFRQKDTYNAHIRFHMGERPYACNFCTKRYVTSSHLKVHMKTHTDMN